MVLKRSKDRKVANWATPSANVSIANAFGLPSGDACPDKTRACDGCYALRLENVYKGIKGVVDHNYDCLLACNGDVEAMANLIRDMIAEFTAECDRKGAPKSFRIHWDGDFFSTEYAEAWARVIRETPDVKYWVYTRSFVTVNVIPTIANIPNLTVYLSVDEYNAPHVPALLVKYPTLRTATLTDTMTSGLPMMRDLTGKPGAMCPEITKQVPLITTEGGACITCGICVDGKADVRFAFTKGRS